MVTMVDICLTGSISTENDLASNIAPNLANLCAFRSSEEVLLDFFLLALVGEVTNVDDFAGHGPVRGLPYKLLCTLRFLDLPL